MVPPFFEQIYMINYSKHLFLFALLCCIVFISCNNNSNQKAAGFSQSDLMGKWQTNVSYDELHFYDNGKGKEVNGFLCESYDITWEIKEDSLFLNSFHHGSEHNSSFHIDSISKVVDENNGKMKQLLYLSFSSRKYVGYPSGSIYITESGMRDLPSRIQEGWLLTKEGLNWLSNDQGKAWLNSNDGKKWLSSEQGIEYNSLEIHQIIYKKIEPQE